MAGRFRNPACFLSRAAVWAVLASATLAGAGELVLENEFVRLAVNPLGGRIEEFSLLPQKLELTSGEGLVGDNFHHVPEAKFFLTKLPYESRRQDGSIELNAHHRGGGIDFMALQKVISLKPGEAMATVRYRFHNLPAAMSTVEYGFWSQNFIGTPQGDINCFFPCMNGIQAIPAARAGAQFSYYKNPSRGWMAFAYAEGGGLAITMDYALLDQFYAWYGAKERTQEFYFDKFKLDSDQAFTTELELLPFHSLKKVSGAGGGLVGDFEVGAEDGAARGHALDLALHSARTGTVRVEFLARRLRDGKPEKFAEHQVVFERAGSIRHIRLKHNFKVSPALLDLEARAYDEKGGLLAIFNTPLGIGTGTIAYRMQPAIDRVKEKGPQIHLRKHDRDLKTTGIEWAKPLAGGKLRIIALTPFQSYRELAELVGKIDGELHTTLVTAQSRPANSSGDYFGLLTEADIADNINALLQEEADVILLAGMNVDKLTPAQRQEILRKVENGCGLVVIGCSGKSPDIAAILPLKPTDIHNYPKLPPRKKQEGFLSTALPWYLLPVTTCLPCAADGEVYAQIGSYPYVAIRDYGRGRVAALPWLTSGGQGRMTGGLTPELPYPLAGAGYGDYAECYNLLLAKMLLAAARRDQWMQFGAVAVKSAPGMFTLDIRWHKLPAPPEKCELTLFSVNRDGEELTRRSFEFVPGAENQFKLPAKAWNGQQLIGLILRNSRGEVTDFGAVSAARLPMARIHSLTADRPHYQEHAEAVFTLKAAVEQRPAELRWRLQDAYDRVVGRGRMEAQPEMTIRVPVGSSLKSRCYTLIAEMFLAGVPVDRHTLPVTATPDAARLRWDDYEVGLWITPNSYDAARAFLHRDLAKALRQMRVTTIMGNQRAVDLEFALRNNFNPTIYQSGGTRPSGIHPDFHRSRDKMLLKRSPCLSDPQFRTEMQKRFAELGRLYQDKGVQFYWFGDELSLTGYWSSAIDFCFSGSCLARFAEFLEKKYGDVEKANAQWGTRFRTFAEFVPDTIAEAKMRPDRNYSAWADHLEYMDSLLCDYIACFTDGGLRRTDAAARSFISGPQGPSAYGGNDWSQQAGAYSGLMSYPMGGLQDVLHSFNARTIDLPWILGYANYDGKVCYELWKSLQYRASGAMGFSAASMLNPDYTLSRSGASAAKYLPEIVEGTGKLVLTALAAPPAPEVMILYSQASIRAAYIENRAKRHDDLRWKYIMLCRNFGIPFEFISDAQLERGELKTTAPRLVIFPDAGALSDRALAAVDSYLAAGGHVLVDGEFAAMDSSCRMRVARRRLTGARVFRAAAGAAGYFESWSNPAAQRSAEENAVLRQTRDRFDELLKKSGIAPLCRLISTADGTPYRDAEITVMKDPQNNRYVLAVSKETHPVQVRAEFAVPATVRDIRQSGNALKDDNPLFFALLQTPEPRPLAVAVSGGRRDFLLKLDLQAVRDTVFRITVQDPAGRDIPHYAANVAARGGRAEYRLTLALNDLPGAWRVTAREIVSGRTAQTVVNCQ